MNYEIIVVGAGSAGLMASAAAGEAGARVLLLDKGDKLGRKLGISGGGRCNVTNAKEIDKLIENIPGNGRYLHSALASFNNRDIIRFFEDLGIRLKEEDNGRMFPVTDKAKTVVDALVGKVRSVGVDIKVNAPVDEVLYEAGRTIGVRLKNGGVLHSNAVIVAVGGKSVPHTGSTGDGYAWAEKAGHTIKELFPTEVPLTSKEAFIKSKELQGLSLRNVVMTVWNHKGKKLISHQGDMIFTHFGISGPIALRCSQFVVKELKQPKNKMSGMKAKVSLENEGAKGTAMNMMKGMVIDTAKDMEKATVKDAVNDTANYAELTAAEANLVKITIDLAPDHSVDSLYEHTMGLCKQESRKSIKNVLKAAFPERLIPLLLKGSGLREDLTYDNIPKQGWLELVKLAKAFPVMVNGTLSIEEAFVTGGGVHLKEIDPKSLQSKLMPGLYFCGEILDIHGYTGGYNITAAFTTGYNAGKHAAENWGS
ncbi:NAD(P)/FAD-dependent oxidoreductase [Paenibacillus sp. HB172176]|uniref:NAD(P)/FAD-dependent oxidoreductase n=1 Tax=Paenibacillus sp. HB172176 TaxID=2493690 RepID=UPI001F0D0C82|nr:NAD(P)/FAD-dependent oxidoreductase [Paenibacillus sp. HB172176]